MGNSITKIYHTYTCIAFIPKNGSKFKETPKLDCQQLQGLQRQRQRQPTSKMLSSCFKRSFSLSTLRLNACSSANKRRKDASPERGPVMKGCHEGLPSNYGGHTPEMLVMFHRIFRNQMEYSMYNNCSGGFSPTHLKNMRKSLG